MKHRVFLVIRKDKAISKRVFDVGKSGMIGLVARSARLQQ